jgi:hypothetical protein
VKRILAAMACLLVPGLLFLNAWEGYRYNELADQVAALEKQQSEILDANRDVIAQITYETSPDRVEQKAAAAPDLKPLDESSITRLQVESSQRGGAGQ